MLSKTFKVDSEVLKTTKLEKLQVERQLGESEARKENMKCMKEDFQGSKGSRRR